MMRSVARGTRAPVPGPDEFADAILDASRVLVRLSAETLKRSGSRRPPVRVQGPHHSVGGRSSAPRRYRRRPRRDIDNSWVARPTPPMARSLGPCVCLPSGVRRERTYARGRTVRIPSSCSSSFVGFGCSFVAPELGMTILPLQSRRLCRSASTSYGLRSAGSVLAHVTISSFGTH